MSSFKKTLTRNFAKANTVTTPDTQYWKNYEFPISVKEYSYIDYINVCPVEPYYIAVTTGPKIDIYHQQTTQVWRTLSQFHRTAYGGKFRNDGQLILAGSEETHVKLFNYRHKQQLRVFKAHSGPVHRVDFIEGKPQAVSFADDKSIILWDITDEKKLTQFLGHTDFIRAGTASQSSEHIIFSGSYDHTVKVWDSRTGECVNTFNHGSPVEDVLCYPSGSVIVSAGGTEIKIWDVIAGRLLSVCSQHHKTITCLSLATKSSRLLSGSLDRHVKVYDVNTYSVVHSMDYPSPVLAVGVAPGDSTIVTGLLSDNAGLVSFQQKSKSKRDTEIQDGVDSSGIFRYKGKIFKPLPGQEVISRAVREKLSKYDFMLKRFEFSKAMDLALQAGTANKTPHVTLSVLRELIRRGGLATAVAGRDAKGLNPLFRFLTKNFRNPIFKPILIEVSSTVLDIYGENLGEHPKIVCQITRLNEEIEKDMVVTKTGINLLGVIDMFMNMSTRPRIAASETLPSKQITAKTSPIEPEATDKEIVDIT